MTFFETLRVEFGNTIGVTIVTPGFIESELTQGKFLHKDGRMEVDQDIRDVIHSYDTFFLNFQMLYLSLIIVDVPAGSAGRSTYGRRLHRRS